MKRVFGETSKLGSRDKTALEKLALKKSNPRYIVDPELAKRASSLSAKLGLQIGLILGRDGRVATVVLGTKGRIYLPDLGRFRLDRGRLRRLRLVVFAPEDALEFESVSSDERFYREEREIDFKPRKQQSKTFSAPILAADLVTDLEKLRLDTLAVISVRRDGSPGPLTIAFLKPQTAFNGAGVSTSSDTAIRSAKDLYDLDISFQEFIAEVEDELASLFREGFDTDDERAILVGAYTGSQEQAESSMDELLELAKTAGIAVVDSVVQRRKKLDPRTLLGKGKIEELVLHCLDLGVDLLVFDGELAPGQLRSITNMTELRVIDRSMLILDIFAQRAVSSDGRLQVELAQLRYSLPRLTETDTGLSRLTGGIGGRGPGETKLEIGRRRARQRIADLEKRIDRLAKQRELRRERRQRRGVPVIAIVGYTNAGKSTLLNALTKGKVFVENKLFATLDTSSRRMRFPNEKEAIFVDTVGFIRELPKELRNAFRATLEEVGEADVLIHLVDASDADFAERIAVVEETLNDLEYGEKPCILVFNKVDLLSDIQLRAIQSHFGGLGVSAIDRRGFPQLILRIQEKLMESFRGLDPGRFIEA